jgi:hypothetical protein
LLTGSADAGALSKIKAAGATFVLLGVDWRAVAPSGVTQPAGFDASSPSDPAYHWQTVDAQVKSVIAAGLEPLIEVSDAPQWAQRGVPPAGLGPSYPSAADFGEFAHAIAQRYSGSFDGLPRVQYWEVWNEPNLSPDLWPQLVNGTPVSPDVYRSLVNAFAAGAKSVHADNLIVAGALAPFRDITPQTYAQDKDWGPLSFMRALLCLSASLHPTCHDPVHFDIWSTHPYTSGGPTHKASLPNDVSIPELPEMTKVLDAAVAAHELVSQGPVRFWVTEFAWASNPPNAGGVPTRLLDRWVPQAMYEFWLDGISMVTWFTVRDQPVASSYYQTGLYYRDGEAKPYLEGFRFPFVAFPSKTGVYIWGRTPGGDSGVVRVEQRGGGAWKALATVRSNPNGIFQETLGTAQTGVLRAVFVSTGETTLPFSLTAVPDQFFNPFGGPTVLEPKKN